MTTFEGFSIQIFAVSWVLNQAVEYGTIQITVDKWQIIYTENITIIFQIFVFIEVDFQQFDISE